MIIQSSRLRTALNLAALVDHVFRGPANLTITALHGGPTELAEMRRDALEAGAAYAIRHFKLSPGQTVTRVDMARLIQDLAQEFGFATARCVVVEHEKPRVGGGYDHHWHLLVPEYDPVARRVLDAHWMRPRQELIARLAELRLGHQLVKGRWNAAVARKLTSDGQDDAAKAIGVLAQDERPAAAYTVRRHQAVARRGIPLPAVRATVVHARQETVDDTGFLEALTRLGLQVDAGDREHTWLVAIPGPADSPAILVGALHRLTRQPRDTVDEQILTALGARSSQQHLPEPRQLG